MSSADRRTRVLVIMGVSGVGKTTVGLRLAERLGWAFYDADVYHPEANIRKMEQGVPLTDPDRWSWLEALRALIETCLQAGRPAVLACSALRTSYRNVLAHRPDGSPYEHVDFIYLQAPFSVVEERIKRRTGHFMPPALLASQFAALEEPGDALVVDATRPVDAVVEEILQRLEMHVE